MPSNLVATVLQDFISSYAGRMDKNEQRPSKYGALNLFKAQTGSPLSILDEDVKANIQRSFNNAVKVPVVNYKDVAIGNVRTCALQTEGITSQLITLTAVTYAFGFVALPMQHYENFVSYQTAVNKLIEAGLQKLAATIDAGCVNILETKKNQYFPQAILDFYAQTANALQVPQAQKNDFYNQLASIMETMDFGSDLDVALNPIGMSMIRRLDAQGEGNSTNEGFQLLGQTWYPTNRITNGGAPIQSTVYAVAPGSVALQSRVDPDSRMRTRIHESKYWDMFPNAPHVGMDLGVFYQADCTDASALQAATLAKFTNTKIESWQFSVDVFYVSAFNSDVVNRYSPILKAEILD
jgi:hypothetical protein